jgi:hypothetical protein
MKPTSAYAIPIDTESDDELLEFNVENSQQIQSGENMLCFMVGVGTGFIVGLFVKTQINKYLN